MFEHIVPVEVFGGDRCQLKPIPHLKISSNRHPVMVGRTYDGIGDHEYTSGRQISYLGEGRVAVFRVWLTRQKCGKPCTDLLRGFAWINDVLDVTINLIPDSCSETIHLVVVPFLVRLVSIAVIKSRSQTRDACVYVCVGLRYESLLCI